MNKIILAILTIFTLISCNDNRLSKKNEIGKDEWTKIATEKKTIKNITYFSIDHFEAQFQEKFLYLQQ